MQASRIFRLTRNFLNNAKCTIHKSCVLEVRDPIETPQLYRQVGLVGAPFEKGQLKRGVGEGPQVMRESGLLGMLLSLGVEVHDYGDLTAHEYLEDHPVLDARHPRAFAENTKQLKKVVHKILNEYGMALVLGGDHSVAAGSILGHTAAKPDVAVVWVDAHADINTPLASASGSLHGMPLAFLLHEIQEDVPWMEEFKDIRPCISSNNLVYIGLRDVDPFEKYLLDKYDILNFSMYDIDRLGMHTVVQKALEKINPNRDRPIHLSFDIDALDPLFATSTGTVVHGGLSIRDGLLLCEEIHDTGCLSVMDMVEVNPKLGSLMDVSRTGMAAVDLIMGAFGRLRGGYVPSFWKTPANLGVRSRADVYKEMDYIEGKQ